MNKIDRKKKYEGLGLTWEHSVSGFWLARDGDKENGLHEPQMQMLLDAGHIQPVKETKIVQVLVGCIAVDSAGMTYLPSRQRCPELTGLLSKPVYAEFEVEA